MAELVAAKNVSFCLVAKNQLQAHIRIFRLVAVKYEKERKKRRGGVEGGEEEVREQKKKEVKSPACASSLLLLTRMICYALCFECDHICYFR